MTLVKICGLTNLEDATVAAEAGADYLGFILWEKSPRAATLENAAAIVQAVRAMNLPKTPICVGVRVSPAAEEVLITLAGPDGAIMDYVQLHKTDPTLLREYRIRTNGHVFMAIQPQTQEELIRHIIGSNLQPDAHRPELPQLLVDAYHPTLVGGTGKQANLDLMRDLPDIAQRIMLAGGLTPDNVADTIRAVRPWAVDVASGVEATPGKKDHGKVRAFIQAVREGDGRVYKENKFPPVDIEQIMSWLARKIVIAAPIPATLEDHIAWLEIYPPQLLSHLRDDLRDKYRVIHYELSNKYYQLYLHGQDITTSESTKLITVFVEEDQLLQTIFENGAKIEDFAERRYRKFKAI